MWHIEVLINGVWTRQSAEPYDTDAAIAFVRYIHNAKARAVWIEDSAIRIYKD